jgi:hypothetical protein
MNRKSAKYWEITTKRYGEKAVKIENPTYMYLTAMKDWIDRDLVSQKCWKLELCHLRKLMNFWRVSCLAIGC